MITTVSGVEHAYDDDGFCQIHGDYCSLAPTSDVTSTCGCSHAEETSDA